MLAQWHGAAARAHHPTSPQCFVRVRACVYVLYRVALRWARPSSCCVMEKVESAETAATHTLHRSATSRSLDSRARAARARPAAPKISKQMESDDSPLFTPPASDDDEGEKENIYLVAAPILIDL